ncbi:NUDIX hydrolase [Pilimelia columellifera]|uniref:Nudix hydrolase domain-containing protein n=1 Tax=Pilimelia columellifera subsp. columellifera TaxID=706583 RepID=A0ABP6AF25_9ACTN
MGPIDRRAARAALIDPAGRVLMIRACYPNRPLDRYWLLPGGGVDAGETPAQALVRELAEETGLIVDICQVGTPTWQDVVEFDWDGRVVRQRQDYFVVPVDAFMAYPHAHTEVERRTISDFRWWTATDLAVAAEPVYPADLRARLEEALRC